MTATPIDNLRHYSRVPFDTKVALHVRGRELTVHLVDIALKGALVESDGAQALAIHDPCRLVLALAHGDEAITMVGRIAHLKDSHVGVECLEIDINSLTLLRRLIELNTGDAERTNQELSHLFMAAWAAYEDTLPSPLSQ
jgi:hypothetical protein